MLECKVRSKMARAKLRSGIESENEEIRSFTMVGMHLQTSLNNSWDETLFNAHFGIEQFMDYSMKKLVWMKTMIESDRTENSFTGICFM